MSEKKEHIRIKEEKREDSSPFAPLAQYDDVVAKEVEDLRSTSAALSKEMEALTEELDSLNGYLQTGDRMDLLRTLYEEQALQEEKILEFQNELPRLTQECAALRSATGPSFSEEKFDLMSRQLEELRGKQEGLSRELPIMERDTASYGQSIAESETQLSETASAIAEMETQSKQLVSEIESLERLEEARSVESTYADEIAALVDGMGENDGQALAPARDIAGRLRQEYGYLGEEIKELLLHLISKLSLKQEVGEKEQIAVSLNAERKSLQGEIVVKTVSLNELKTFNSENKRMLAALASEINRYRAPYAENAEAAADGDIISRKKEIASAEFISLFVQKAELQEKVLTVDGKLRTLMDIVGKTA